jgi:hypothetical protein
MSLSPNPCLFGFAPARCLRRGQLLQGFLPSDRMATESIRIRPHQKQLWVSLMGSFEPRMPVAIIRVLRHDAVEVRRAVAHPTRPARRAPVTSSTRCDAFALASRSAAFSAPTTARRAGISRPMSSMARPRRGRGRHPPEPGLIFLGGASAGASYKSTPPQDERVVAIVT